MYQVDVCACVRPWTVLLSRVCVLSWRLRPCQDKNGGDVLLGCARVALKDLDPEMLSADDDDPSAAVHTQLSMPAVTVRLRYLSPPPLPLLLATMPPPPSATTAVGPSSSSGSEWDRGPCRGCVFVCDRGSPPPRYPISVVNYAGMGGAPEPYLGELTYRVRLLLTGSSMEELPARKSQLARMSGAWAVVASVHMGVLALRMALHTTVWQAGVDYRVCRIVEGAVLFSG
jgi:hypothetical protein